MTRLKVALLQMASCGSDTRANMIKGDRFCREARAMGADLAVFPEMWSNGYSLPAPDSAADRAAWASQAVDQADGYLQHFRALARELGMAIAVTYLERWEPGPRNTVSLIDRSGEIALTYAKVHTCEFSLEAALTPGDSFPVCTLATAAGDVRVGAMICYDREFPESARILMLAGAELIIVPNACEIDQHRRAQLQTRAYENMVGVALVNRPSPQDNGHSVAFDGMAYTQGNGDEDGVARDMTLVEAGDVEGVFIADFDLDALRAYRARETWGDAFRRPRLYGALVSDAVKPPFIRPCARR